jgi:sulfur reductase molybdopterin subunit
MEKEDNKLKISRRDFIKITAVTGIAASAAYLASKKFGFTFNIFSQADPIDDEQFQPGWQYSYVPNTCAFCSSTCDILVTTESKNGYIRALEIDGNPLSPLNKGKVCPRGRSGIFRTYNVDRIKTPLIRTGPKGTWAFKEATWEEALNYIMQKLKELNVQPWEFLLIGGALPCANYKRQFIPFTLGTQMPNINGTPMQSCMFSLQQPIGTVIGGFDLHATDVMDDMSYSSLIVVWGDNGFPAGIFVNRAVRFGEGIANGAYVIDIDPRMSEAASKADLWVPVKPGSDLTLALAIINYIIQNNYYDDNFVRYYTNVPFLAYEENGVLKLLDDKWPDGTVKGFYVYDEISDQVVEVPPFTNTNQFDVNGKEIRPGLKLSPITYNGKQVTTVFQHLANRVSKFTLEYASQVADVPLNILQEVAYRIATTKPMEIVTGLKGFWSDFAPQFRRAVAIIMSLTGNIDVRGAWLYSGKYREGMKEVINAYNSAISSGTSKPGILLQRPEILSQVPLLDLPGELLTIFGIIYAYNNPQFWKTGYPALSYAYAKTLMQQGKTPVATFGMFLDTGAYEAIKGEVMWNGEPYIPKAAMSYGGTPFNFLWKQYKKVLENAFYIDINILPTEDTLYADVILPDVSYLERDEDFRYDGSAPDYALRGRWQTIPRLYPNTANGLDLFVMFAYMLGKEAGDGYVEWMANSVSIDREIFKQIIAEEMPQYQEYLIKNNGYPPWGSFTADAWRQAKVSFLSKKLNIPEEEITSALRNNGVFIIKTLDEYFSNNERMPWNLPVATPTGRIEIYSTVLYYYVTETFGYNAVWDPLISYIPPWWNAGYAVQPGVFVQPSAPYDDPTFKPTPPEMFFIEYKVPQFAYTSSTDNPMLMSISLHHESTTQMAWINPATAAQLGINEGDWITIVRWKLPDSNGEYPELTLRAHLTQFIRPDTIGVPEAYGQRNPALTTSIKSIPNAGNKPVSELWPESYNPLGGYRQVEQFTVYVRKATSDEISEATTLASVETSNTLPSKVVVTPDTKITPSEWNEYEQS